MKIISGGQSGADLAGNYFAKKHGIETEINAEKNYKPLYDDIPTDIKINIVSNKEGYKGGWIDRRKYNIKSSDFTLILLYKPIEFTRGSKGTYNDCIKFNKDVLYINVIRYTGVYHNGDLPSSRIQVIQSLDDAKSLLRIKNPQVINIAGQRDLDRADCIKFLEKLFIEK